MVEQKASSSLLSKGSHVVSKQWKQKSTLSSKEIMERRVKGQCFPCDDAYHPEKECKAKLYLMMGEEEELKEDWQDCKEEIGTLMDREVETEEIPRDQCNSWL